MRQPTDVDLVLRARAGDEDAFAALAAGIVDRCFALAYRILRDSMLAHDAAQRALLGVWQDLPTLADAARFDAWLHRIIVHACYAEARRDRRWQARVRLAVIRPTSVPDPAASVVDRDALEEAFRALGTEHRAVIVLHHYLGYPLVEVAEVLGIPVGTARSRLHYALKRMRAAMVDTDVRSRERTA